MANNDSVEIQLKKILDEYQKEVEQDTDEAFHAVADEAVQRLKNTSPVRKTRGGKYARSWTSTTRPTRGNIDSVIIHNRRYQLTHLLEKGHLIVQNGKVVGRANPIEHIAPVEQWANNEVVETIKRKLK